jgi:hypothetical protein
LVRITLLAGVLVAACGSRKESADAPEPSPASASNASAVAPAAARPVATGPLSHWQVVDTSASSKPAYPFNHAFALPPPAPAPDPDAVIDRYIKECGAKTTSAECSQLKRSVEGAFLDALVELRGTEDIDPEWYRIGVTAETPQLACISVTEIVYLPGRTTDDVALLVKALDSPWRSVRNAVLSNASRIPGLEGVAQRADRTTRDGSQTCFDSVRDPQPGPEWAGNYPGARYRAFASNPDLRWFTSTDPVEKVLAFFAGQGKPGRTSQQLGADASARFVEEATRLSSSPDAGNEARLMELMQGMGGGQDWSRAFHDLRDIGEIKYVMLTSDQAVAVFHDDLMKTTAIVAPRPSARPNLSPDMAKAQQEAMARSIYGF